MDDEDEGSLIPKRWRKPVGGAAISVGVLCLAHFLYVLVSAQNPLPGLVLAVIVGACLGKILIPDRWVEDGPETKKPDHQ